MPPSRPFTRRSGLRAALLAAAGWATAPTVLTGCFGGSEDTAGRLPTASPDNPVLWPISTDNPPIASGGSPEQGVPLKIFNYPDYIDPNATLTFELQYGVPVEIVTFDDATAALEAVRGGTDYDVYFPSYDQIGRLVTEDLIRPLNQSYVPNIGQVWPDFANPFYDQQWRYSVPYTVYNSGIAWRTDLVTENLPARPNPFDVFWDDDYRGRVSVLDDYRTTMGMVLLNNDRDLNTTNTSDIDFVRGKLDEMIAATAPAVTIANYLDLPAGAYPIVHAWSGDVVNALNYLPEGVDPGVLRYWSPSDGREQCDNDLMVVLRGGRCPVAAHLFLNHMLSPDVALANFGAIGYQPPQNTITPAGLVAQRFLPQTLANATVAPEYFATGRRTLELPVETDASWQAVWDRFRAQAT